MLPKFREELTRLLPAEMSYPYFRGREAAWLLHQRITGPTRIASLRAGPLAPLLDRPGVRDVVAACGDGRLTADRLLPLADPLRAFESANDLVTDRAAETAFERLCAADVRAFTVSFAGWAVDTPRRLWRDAQISRPGANLVVQVNFPDDYTAEFACHFDADVRRALEYWCHPVRRDGPITMAWARLDFDPWGNEVLIEEVQTDWLRVIRGQRRHLCQSAPQNARPAARAFIDVTQSRYGRDWAEATLMAAIAFARSELGVRHVWLHQPRAGAKLKNIRWGGQPPRSLYCDLPRRFCFRPTDRAPDFLYRARSQAVHRLRRSGRAVFWYLDLDAPATVARADSA